MHASPPFLRYQFNSILINVTPYCPIMLLSLQAIIIAAAMSTASQSWETTPHGLKVRLDSVDVELAFFTPSTVRVIKTPAGKNLTEESLSIIAKPGFKPSGVERNGKKLTVKSPEMAVTLDMSSGEVSFRSKDGKRLLSEKGNARFSPMDDAGRPALTVRQDFRLDKDEMIYGLGNLENGSLSQRGISRRLMPGNVEDGIPVIQSEKGYGLIWDNYSPTLFDDNALSTTFESEVGEGVDYYFTFGGDADGVIAGIRQLSGSVPMFPLWTYGYWQSRERYKSQEELLDVVRKHRELGIPLDGIIQDWQYWGNNYLWNAMEFMSPDFPDPKGMVDEIHGRNAHAIISIWSSFGPQTKPYRELDEKGLLFDFHTWPQSGISHIWPPRMDYPSGVRVYDAYSPEARDIYWKHLSRLYDFNFDGWWMDSTEPDHHDVKPEDFDTPTRMGSFRKVRNAYPLMTVGGVHDHQRAADDSRRVFILTRSGYTGQQRYGCNVWTGDVTSTWDNLRKQVPAALNFTLTGNPNVNSDIGGFFCGDYNKSFADNSATRNPAYQELYVRWLQFGLLSPMMRSHGTDAFREIYQFGKEGEPVYDAIAEAIRLRYRLLPYIYSTSWDVTSRNGSFMRALMMDFPKDRNALDRGDEFMFGREILAAPILEAKYTRERTSDKDDHSGWDASAGGRPDSGEINFLDKKDAEVYLPAGTIWYDFHSGKSYAGGKTITILSDIFTIPIYVKAGSIIPLGPDVQYATEKPWDNLEIRIYPGADGMFILYEDEFDNYNYEKGAYSTIEFNWDDRNHTLTIADRDGSFPGMIGNRIFNVILCDGKSAGNKNTISYSGEKKIVKF